MGSEGPSVVTVHVTGFKKFHGVAENPTEKIVGNLKSFVEKKGLPKNLVLGSCTVLETAGQGALGTLYKVLESAIAERENGPSAQGQTTLPVNELTKSLRKTGYDVMPSDDAGRFVCNYVYYHSLRFAEQHGIKSLFVHVPLFLTIDEEVQMHFVASLLEALAVLN
uniref:Pyrrolidone-carboxylate peptidase n=1 Tax=Oryza punctata TaxID=4537 RepID=A0A0E0LNW8_ORYPU